MEKIFWEFDSIIMQNLFDILLLFCISAWSSYHMSENPSENILFAYKIWLFARF